MTDVALESLYTIALSAPDHERLRAACRTRSAVIYGACKGFTARESEQFRSAICFADSALCC